MLRKVAILLDPAAGGGGGGGAAPAAPAAPAAAPAPAPAPKPDATPAPAGGSEPDPFDALDKRITPKARAADDATKDKKDDLRDKTADPKPGEKPADAPPAAEAGRKIESGPKALREQLEKTNGELKTFREKTTALEAKIAEYEAKGKDTTALAEQLAKREKEMESLQSELRALRHESSPEFKAKYEAPFNRAAETAKKIVTQLTTAAKENEDGTTTPGRAATWDDFAHIFSLPYGKAQETAEALFGKNERVIMSHYDRLHTLQDEKTAALEEERANFKAREESEQANRAKNIEGIQTAWRTVNAELIEKNPELYAATPKDADEEKLVADAYALWDAKPKTWQQQVVKDAHIRNKLAGFYLARHKLNKANARIAELEGVIAEMKGSKPGSTTKPGAVEVPTEKNWSDDLREALA